MLIIYLIVMLSKQVVEIVEKQAINWPKSRLVI